MSCLLIKLVALHFRPPCLARKLDSMNLHVISAFSFVFIYLRLQKSHAIASNKKCSLRKISFSAGSGRGHKRPLIRVAVGTKDVFLYFYTPFFFSFHLNSILHKVDMGWWGGAIVLFSLFLFLHFISFYYSISPFHPVDRRACLLSYLSHFLQTEIYFFFFLKQLFLQVVYLGEKMAQHPLVQRLLDVKFDTKRFVAIATHGPKNFPDAEGRKFFADHFDVTIQVKFV